MYGQANMQFNMNNININVNNNNFMNNMNNSNNKNETINSVLSIGEEEFNIILQKNINTILIILKPKVDFLSLYDYSIELSYENFYKLGKSFRTYDNINDIFDLLSNIFKSITISFNSSNNQNMMNNNQMNATNNNVNRMNNSMINNMNMMNNYMNNSMNNQMSMMNNNQINHNKINSMSSNARLEYEYDNSIVLYLNIPLLNGKNEEIKIGFNKKEKNLKTQFKKLKDKYLKIKSIVYGRNNTNQQLNNVNNINMNNLSNNMKNNMNFGNNFLSNNIIRNKTVNIANNFNSNDQIVREIKNEMEKNDNFN